MKPSQTCSQFCKAHGTDTPTRIGLRLSTVLAAMLILASCVYDAPGDKFFRTLWHSEEIPLGPFDVSSLTLEFLCNGGISIKTSYSPDTELYAEDEISITARQNASVTPDIRTIYGRYEPDGTTAVLEDLQITLDDIDIIFIEAHRSGDTLFLLWRIEDSLYPFTTALHPPSAYPDGQ